MELIKDRLSHILRAKNLTATQFAELMQIQPSNVSHLLSGRNKPSLDFLIKLKEVFPEYNYEWIILGKKPITTNEPALFNKENVIEAVEKTHSVDNKDVKNDNILFEPHYADVEDAPIVPVQQYLNKNNAAIGLKQIIYVYDDHTFEVYNVRK